MDILEAIANLESWIDDWNNDDTRVMWHGRLVPSINEYVMQGAKKLLEALESAEEADLPKDIWHTVLAADDFAEAFANWKTGFMLPGAPLPPSGDERLWAAYRAMIAAKEPRRFTKPETLEELMRQKVPFAQIAKIYGWTLPNGAPDTHKVLEEQAQPGTHLNLDEWMAPHDRDRERELEVRWKERLSRMEQSRAEAAEAARPGPETLEDLLQLSDITIKAIQKIRPDDTIEEILAAADAMKVRLPDRPVPSLGKLAKRGDREREREEERKAELDEADKMAAVDWEDLPDDLDLRMVALRESGLTATQISDLITQQTGEPCSPQRVGRVIKRHQRRQAVEKYG